MLIDLQLHSNYSDGYLSPTELVRFIKSKGVKVAALTDHNTTEGLDEFFKETKRNGIKPIVGMEIYAKYKTKKINLLWYNFDRNNLKLQEIMESSRRRRALLVKNILLKLRRRGYKIDVDKILSEFKHYIPVNRLADKIVEEKFNYNLVFKNVKEKRKKFPGFSKKMLLPLREDDILGELFFNKKIGRLNESYINIERLFRIKKEVGGQIIFCHPGKYNKFAKNMTEKLKEMGLDGIEVLSPHHSIGAIMYSQFLSEKLDLIATGGSDFHLPEGGSSLIQDSWEWFKVDSKYLRRVKEIIG
jgi:3',5'-nucleoside bisphosphate phosphatase